MVTLYNLTEEEKFEILDRLFAGDPVVWGRLVILERKQELEKGQEPEEV